MFANVYSLIRVAVEAALPTGLFSQDRILREAVDLDVTPLATSARYVAITMEAGQPSARSIGPRPRHEFDGAVSVIWYEPSGAGDGTQLTRLSEMAEALVNQRLVSGTVAVRLQSPGISNGVREGSHWTKILRIPFRATYHYPA